MKSRRLFWKIYLSFLLITLFSALAVGWYASSSLSRFYLDKIADDLKARAWLTRDELQREDILSDAGQVDELCKRIGAGTSTRITVILRSGKVIGDSMEEPSRMMDHSDRPEVKEALSGKTGKAVRFSPTLKQRMLYLALPVDKDGEIEAVVRASASLQSIQDAIRSIYLRIFIAGLIIVIVSGLISYGIARGITLPLEELKKGAQLFADGDLRHHLSETGSEEVAGLALAMNRMAEELDRKIKELSAERNEREAILSSIVEGVLAVDREGNIISVNEAGAKMLGISGAQARGKSIEEMIRNPALQNLIRRALSETVPVEAEIVLNTDGEKFFQAHAAVISDAQGNCIGAVIVLNDITRLKRMEKVRKEFVANVSHEMKTPLTAINGAVETLLSGALRNSQDAEKFLTMIKNNSERLNAIVNDLLLLAQIEHEDENLGIKLEERALKRILESAIQSLKPSASEKSISIELSCPENLVGRVNPAMLEQSVVNLLDNAVKYSDPGKVIKVSAESKEKWIVVSVEDQGFGIAKEHLERIFERFYVVDKSRSRRLGGTGLGLAIVKHIAQAHQGYVSVESELGKGSKFQIYIPS